MLIRPLSAAVALSLGSVALAQTPAGPAPAAPAGATTTTTASGETPRKIRSVQLIGDQKCPPPSSPDEVVVCARISPGEQYRIPKELRNEGPVPVQRQSWAARQDTVDEIAREAGGLPDTCSPSGSGGQTGCTKVMLDRYRADKRAGTTNPPR